MVLVLACQDAWLEMPLGDLQKCSEVVHLQDFDEEDDPEAAEKAEKNQQTLSGLRWIAKRTSAATKSLTLDFRWYEERIGSKTLVPSFSELAHLSNLRCLTFQPQDENEDLALVDLLDWLLQQAPKIEAMETSVGTRCLPASHMSFQNLRHLVLTTDWFPSHEPFLVAQQLPVMETLYLDGSYIVDAKPGVLDMSGCKRLRQIVLCEAAAQELVWDDTAGPDPCPLVLELPDVDPTTHYGPHALQNLALAQQIVIHGFGFGYSLLGASSQLRVLVLRWPIGGLASRESDCDDDFEDVSDEGPDSFASCMPDDGQPLLNLATIIITGCTRLYDFPGPQQLPHLKELVFKTPGPLEIYFEDVVGTISGLDSLCLFGQPLRLCTEDMMKLMAASGALEQRGLVLGAAIAAQQDGLDSSCIYLRPIGTPELSIEELGTKVWLLVRCRCGACFNCVRRAGRIEG